MAEASLTNSRRPGRFSPDSAVQMLRTVISFAAVLVVLVILWQLIKAVFRLDTTTLPHIGDILGSLFQPIQEDKPVLGLLLLNSALFTFREAVAGFALGALFGFLLAVIFAHSSLLERGLMPFVVASQ